jgi:hypothetical protein
MEAERIKKRRLRYASAGPTIREDMPRLAEQDDPLSPNFVPLEERGPLGQARFWALRAQGDKRQKAGVFDG